MFFMVIQEWFNWLSSQNIPLSDGVIPAGAKCDDTDADSIITLLGQQRLVAFAGEESRKFLQGQVTCDVNKLANGESVLGACCNPKGRMIANFRMVAVADALLMALPSDQVDYLCAHLKKYAAFFRTVTMADVTDQWLRIGVQGANMAGLLTRLTGVDLTASDGGHSWQHGVIIPLGAERYELWIHSDAGLELCQSLWLGLSEIASVVPSQYWSRLDIESGLAWVTEATREQWIPQHLNWQAVDGISFKKGCYTGQEIVARMKYLGKLKSHLYRLSVAAAANGEAPAAVGDGVLNCDGAKCGDIVAIEPRADQGWELLAVVRKADWENGALTTGAGVELNPKPLPYSIED